MILRKPFAACSMQIIASGFTFVDLNPNTLGCNCFKHNTMIILAVTAATRATQNAGGQPFFYPPQEPHKNPTTRTKAYTGTGARGSMQHDTTWRNRGFSELIARYATISQPAAHLFRLNPYKTESYCGFNGIENLLRRNGYK